MTFSISLDEQRAELARYFEPVDDAQRARIAEAWDAAVADPAEAAFKQIGRAMDATKSNGFTLPSNALGYGMAWLEEMEDWREFTPRNYFRALVAWHRLAAPKPAHPAWACGTWLWESSARPDGQAEPVAPRIWHLPAAGAARTVGDPDHDRRAWCTRENPPSRSAIGGERLNVDLAFAGPGGFRTWPVLERDRDTLALGNIERDDGRTFRLRRLPPHVAIVPGIARTPSEVMYFIAGSRCHACDGVGLDRVYPQHDAGVVQGVCPSCKAAREFRFAPVSLGARAPVFQLGDGTSTVFSAEELRALAAAALAQVPRDATSFATKAAYVEARKALVRGYLALVELSKHQPDDDAVAAEVRAVDELYRAYERGQQVVESKPGALARPRSLEDRFRQHAAWLDRGRAGDGRLVLAGEAWREQKFPPRLDHAQLDSTTLERCDLSNADLTRSTASEARLIECRLGSIKLREATWTKVDLRGSRMPLATIAASTFHGGDWRELAAGRTDWGGRFVELDLRDADLSDGVFADARFERCDLRGADLRRVDDQLVKLGRATRTQFVDCDLRGAKLDGLRLDQVRFERCKLADLDGAPAVVGAVEMIDGDLSPGGDGSIGGAEQLLALWTRRTRRG